MRRRRLLQTGLALAGGSLATRSLSWAGTPAPAGLYPPALRPGSRIAALAPGTWLDPNDPWLDQLSRRCKAQGWELVRPPALQRRLRMRSSSLQQINLVDVTGKSFPADYGLAAELIIGRARFGVIPIAFADIAPFKALQLDKKPAMFLGMNALRNFDRVAIDFANRKIYFLLPAGA